MNNDIFFSIILPLYNKERHIKQTLTSILEQSFTNYELLVIDDGSTDSSCTIVKSFGDPRISLIQQPNGGPSKARNKGIKEAKGEYIAFIDADDSWYPEYLENQNLIFIQNSDIKWSCVGYHRVRGNKVIKTYCYPKHGVIHDVAEEILHKPYIWTGAVAVKSDVFNDKRFYFNEYISRSEDLELWFKLACKYPRIGYINKVLANYQVSVNDSLTFTAHENEDFSYITLRQRIDPVLNQIESTRKEKIIFILESFCRRELLKTWKSTNLFKTHQDKFRSQLDKNLYTTLIYLDFLPTLLKKVYIRLLENLKLFGHT